MLSDGHIATEVSRGRITINPPAGVDQLQPASVDVTLGDTIRVFRPRGLGRRVWIGDIPDDLTEARSITGGIVLTPGEFILATTAERVELPADICGFLHGRSTLGRLGLLVHATAGLIDPGYRGQITLEVSNIGPLELELRPGDRIGQLTFERMSSRCARPYGAPGLDSHYQGQIGPTPPRSGTCLRVAEPTVAPVVALKGRHR